MNNFLARIAGARGDILNHLPGARSKQAAMGAVLLTTAGFAVISAAYALNIVGIANGFVCVIAGLVWGLAILNLDRMLVLGLSGEKSWGKTLMLALPRVGLAIVIGLVISTPLMLKVFDSEIQAQLNENILTAQEEQRIKNNNSTANADLATDETKAAEMRAMINAGPTADPAASPKVQAVQAEIDSLAQKAEGEKAEADKLRAAAVAEEEGTSGTGDKGCAAMCFEKKRLASEAEGRWQSTQDAITAKEREKADVARSVEGSLIEESTKAIDDAKKELPLVDARIEQLRKQVNFAEDSSYESQSANRGIIARLKALDDLSADSTTARTAHRMVALLFMCIEILPVLFKVLSNFGTRTAYDSVNDAFEGEEVRTATAEVDNRKFIAELRRDAALAAEKQRITKQHETILRINDTVVDHQADVVDKALAEWSQHAKRASADRLDAWANGLLDLETNGAATIGAPAIAGSPGGVSAVGTYARPANEQRTIPIPITHLRHPDDI